MNEIENDHLTYSIIGCAMNVHNQIGCGFQEVIYQKCLALELNKQGLSFAREIAMPIFYNEIKVGSRRVDFIVENEVMLELKAVVRLEDVHLAQGINYLNVYDLYRGLLLNFGNTKLEVKRLFRR